MKCLIFDWLKLCKLFIVLFFKINLVSWKGLQLIRLSYVEIFFSPYMIIGNIQKPDKHSICISIFNLRHGVTLLWCYFLRVEPWLRMQYLFTCKEMVVKLIKTHKKFSRFNVSGKWFFYSFSTCTKDSRLQVFVLFTVCLGVPAQKVVAPLQVKEWQMVHLETMLNAGPKCTKYIPFQSEMAQKTYPLAQPSHPFLNSQAY